MRKDPTARETRSRKGKEKITFGLDNIHREENVASQCKKW